MTISIVNFFFFFLIKIQLKIYNFIRVSLSLSKLYIFFETREFEFKTLFTNEPTTFQVKIYIYIYQ